tara:strand:- start:164 stop:589 length:426 start_codon:yes stop_codon:yes gene_type:complete
MKKYLISFLFLSLFILNSCADVLYESEETEVESLPYIDCEWLFCSRTSIDTLNLNSWLLPFWIIDTTFRSSTLYKLTDATDTPALWENERPGSDEYRTEVESKYIHYFRDERLVIFERISDTEPQTIPIHSFINEIKYKEK